MYQVILGDMLLPITPSSIDIKINGQNETMNLINDSEVSIIKKQGLRVINFSFELPNTPRSYGVETFGSAIDLEISHYLNLLESYMAEKRPIAFTVLRHLPNGKALHTTDMQVTIENYSLKEDYEQGFDTIIDIELKQYKAFETKTISSVIDEDSGIVEVTKENNRETSNSPEPKTPITYVVKSGDTLWGIAKKYYGDGSKYTIIAEENKLSNPNMLNIGQNLTIPVL